MDQIMLPIILAVAFGIRVPITDASNCASSSQTTDCASGGAFDCVFDHVPYKG